MNRHRAASLLPVLFAFVSLGTVACAAESESPSDVASRGPAAESPVDALAGSARTPAPAGDAAPAIGSETHAGTTPFPARLVVTEEANAKPVVYDVLSYDLGVEMATMTAGSSGLGAGKAMLLPLNVRVANAKSHLLAKDLFGVANVAKVVLERFDVTGKPIELATLELAAVTRSSATADGSLTDDFQIVGTKLSVSQGAARVTVDIKMNTAVCADPCPCALSGNTAKLGPYTQSGSLGAVPKGNTRIDSVVVELHQEGANPGAGAGASAGKPVLDGITLEGPLEASGVCAVYHAARGDHAPDVRIGVAGASAKGTAVETTTWNACLAQVERVVVSSSESGPQAQLHLGAGGLVRTDRAFDALGKQTSEAKTGWSFVTQQAITSCSALLP